MNNNSSKIKKNIPKDWKLVKFGDIAKKINDLYPDRSKWHFERYVSGTNFVPGEIKLARSKPIKGNEKIIGYQFQWRFQPGDVLYVVKNPRLRKAAMVDFEGICSISSFVIRTDNSKFLQKLLPFLLQTEDFVSFARKHEHGSTNPFLNWKDIAKYQFFLPPINEQKKISDVLWSIENHIDKLKTVIQKLEIYKNSKTIKLLRKGINHTTFKKEKWYFGKQIEIPKEWKILSLEKIFTINMGQSPPSKSYNTQRKGLPFFQGVADFGQIYPKAKVWCTDPKKTAKENEILLSVRAPVGEINLTNEECCIGRGITSLMPKNNDLQYCVYLLKNYKNLFSIFSRGTTFDAISKNDFSNLSVPFTDDKNEQKEISKILKNLEDQDILLNTHLSKLKQIRSSVLNEKLTPLILEEKPLVQ